MVAWEGYREKDKDSQANITELSENEKAKGSILCPQFP